MNKFIEFSKKYNLCDLLLIFLFLLILYPLFYAKQSTYFVDYGRETYIPWQMLNGEVLYKDIFNVYGPLGYQINTLAYKFFGIHLNTLYGLGFLNSFLASSFVYLISKIFLDRKISLGIAGVIITSCVYSVGVHNLVMPYSFNAVYAMTSVLVSIYTMLLYIKEKNRRNLILSFLFAGFSFANKIEYLPYFLFLFVLLPFLSENKKDWKSYLAPTIAFLVFPLLSLGTLLIQGVTFADFQNTVSMMKKLLDTSATKYFYYEYGLYFNPARVVYVLIIFGRILLKIVPLFCIFYVLNFVNYKYINSKLVKGLLNTFIMVLIFVGIINNYSNSLFTDSLSWLGMIILLLTVGFVLYELWKFYKTREIEISKQNKLFLFLSISSILLSLKGLFCTVQDCYGSLTIPLLIIPFYVFGAKYTCVIFDKINVDVLKKTIVNLTSIVLIFFLCANINTLVEREKEIVETERGEIFVPFYKGQKLLLEYIKNNTPKNATLVVLPEGSIINFLSERKSHNYYYYLIPVNIQVFGEDKILEDFKKNPPDYFYVYNLPSIPYNEGTFGQYAPKITNFILQNYSLVLNCNDIIDFSLYRRK